MSFLRPPSVFPVAPDITGVRVVMANLYFIALPDSDAWVLVDAGVGQCGPHVAAVAARRFGAGNPPRAIILTHGHFDHVGALPWGRRPTKAPVYAHPKELPFLNQLRPYPAPDPAAGGGLMAWTSFMLPRRGPYLARRVEPLPENGVVPELPEWRWIPTPGHSPGHISLWRERDELLIAGDAVICTQQESALAVLSQRPQLRRPPAYFTPDWTAAAESIARLAALRPRTIASGHGQVLSGPKLSPLAALATDFTHTGLPHHGRYARYYAPPPQEAAIRG